jgi:hypothetical protein
MCVCGSVLYLCENVYLDVYKLHEPVCASVYVRETVYIFIYTCVTLCKKI